MAFPVSISFNARDKVSPAVRKMNKSVSRFSRNSNRSFRDVGSSLMRMRTLIVGAGAAIATGRLARGISDFTEQAADIERTSRQLGLTSESYQKLSFAAKQYGVEQEALRDGLKELSLRADEFAVTGAGPAAEAMERLGLSQAEINSRKGDTQALFQLVNRELQGIQDVAARQRIVDELFGGTGGEQMVEMAAASSEELSKLTDEAKEMGLISSEAGQASERFSQTMDKLRQAARGAMSQAIVPLVEELTPLITKTSEWISENKELISLKVQETFDRIRQAVQILVRAWDSGLIPAIIAGVAAFKTLTTAVAVINGLKVAMGALNIVMAANPVGLLVVGIAALVAGITLLWNRSEKFRNTLKNVWANIKQIATAGPRLLGKLGSFFGIGDGGGGGQATSRNAGVMENRSVTENRSRVDVNMAGLPQGSTVRQRGNAPGVNVNYGFAQGGL